MNLTDTFCTKTIFFSFTNFECSYFVANATKTLFARFSINTNFLSKNPTTWNDDPGYESGLQKLQKTVVVNGIAERGVKLIQECNNILTKMKPRNNLFYR